MPNVPLDPTMKDARDALFKLKLQLTIAYGAALALVISEPPAVRHAAYAAIDERRFSRWRAAVDALSRVHPAHAEPIRQHAERLFPEAHRAA